MSEIISSSLSVRISGKYDGKVDAMRRQNGD